MENFVTNVFIIESVFMSEKKCLLQKAEFTNGLNRYDFENVMASKEWFTFSDDAVHNWQISNLDIFGKQMKGKLILIFSNFNNHVVIGKAIVDLENDFQYIYKIED